MSLIITEDHFREYRKKLGFTSQTLAKDFFGAKDVAPRVDLAYIKCLNSRLGDIVERINNVVTREIRSTNIEIFKQEFIDNAFEIIKDNNILPSLNNQGRRPEQVYFSWMRGYILSNYFLRALGLIFEVDIKKIKLIGDDDLRNIESFKRTPSADLEIKLNKKEKIRIEMQSGFTGINDIKQHKVVEAKNVFRAQGVPTVAIHVDIYNGQAAFVRLNEIKDSDVNWITRQQMEGQTVFNIDQNYFVWKLTEKPVKYGQIDLR